MRSWNITNCQKKPSKAEVSSYEVGSILPNGYGKRIWQKPCDLKVWGLIPIAKHVQKCQEDISLYTAPVLPNWAGYLAEQK